MCSRNDYENGRKPVKPGCRNRKKKKRLCREMDPFRNTVMMMMMMMQLLIRKLKMMRNFVAHTFREQDFAGFLIFVRNTRVEKFRRGWIIRE